MYPSRGVQQKSGIVRSPNWDSGSPTPGVPVGWDSRNFFGVFRTPGISKRLNSWSQLFCSPFGLPYLYHTAKNCESSTARSAGEASSVTAERRAKRGAMRSAGAGRAIPLLRLFTLAEIDGRKLLMVGNFGGHNCIYLPREFHPWGTPRVPLYWDSGNLTLLGLRESLRGGTPGVPIRRPYHTSQKYLYMKHQKF